MPHDPIPSSLAAALTAAADPRNQAPPSPEVLAAVYASEVTRRQYSAALVVGADKLDGEAMQIIDLLTSGAPLPSSRTDMRMKAQALRCRARDIRRLATQLAEMAWLLSHNRFQAP